MLIEVYSFNTAVMPSVEDLFIEINSAEPVKAIDMPTEVGSTALRMLSLMTFLTIKIIHRISMT